jgi:hypothetical protein
MVSPLRAEKLSAAKLRQLGGVEVACCSSPVSVDACRSKSDISSSLIAVIGTGADEAARPSGSGASRSG